MLLLRWFQGVATKSLSCKSTGPPIPDACTALTFWDHGILPPTPSAYPRSTPQFADCPSLRQLRPMKWLRSLAECIKHFCTNPSASHNVPRAMITHFDTCYPSASEPSRSVEQGARRFEAACFSVPVGYRLRLGPAANASTLVCPTYPKVAVREDTVGGGRVSFYARKAISPVLADADFRCSRLQTVALHHKHPGYKLQRETPQLPNAFRLPT